MFGKDFLILTGRGFCSEITTTLLARLYCLDKNINFALCSKYWNAAHHQGWEDYFVPFCEEISTRELNISYLFSCGGLRETAARAKKKLLLTLQTRRHVLLNYDVWSDIWNHAFVERTFRVPAHSIDGDCFTACQAILDKTWRFNAQTTKFVASRRESLGLANRAYFTVHVRRGDKSSEAKPINVCDYMRKAEDANRGQLQKCFVMTDDYDVVSELRRDYVHLEFVSLCLPSARGHAQTAFNSQPPEVRRDETLRLLSELAIAADGAFFVGTFSSNIGRFVALLRGRESTFGVDIPFTMVY
jgi:Alpha-(1,6)-fucosyltransferase N- and catalytic domains